MTAILEVRDLSVSYGAIKALKGVSLSLSEGEIVTLIGANGAGKTTTLRAIMGLVHPSGGEVRYRGEPTRSMPTHRLVREGLVLVPEGRIVFANLTVQENLEMGAYARRDAGVASDYEKVYTLFPRLKERLKQTAGTLSGGEQQMLAIGRALMSKPRVVLLDEPSMGLAPLLIDEVFRILTVLKSRGITMLLVEQLAYRALAVADSAYVIEHGRIEISGEAKALAKDPRVRAAYLGEAAAKA